MLFRSGKIQGWFAEASCYFIRSREIQEPGLQCHFQVYLTLAGLMTLIVKAIFQSKLGV